MLVFILYEFYLKIGNKKIWQQKIDNKMFFFEKLKFWPFATLDKVPESMFRKTIAFRPNIKITDDSSKAGLFGII